MKPSAWSVVASTASLIPLSQMPSDGGFPLGGKTPSLRTQTDFAPREVDACTLVLEAETRPGNKLSCGVLG